MRTAAVVLLASLALSGFGHAETRVPASQGEIALSFVPVVREASPAVVNIYARRMVQGRRNSPFDNDPFFGPLFRDLAPTQPQIQNSLGSGVILSPDGLVVSNYHVVGEASEIRVVLNDRREYEADILLGDEETDLAVLRLRGARDLPSLTLRDTDNVEVGELVLAIGNPFGVGQTVTSGIVSGLARSGTATGSARGWFIQTDAAINPGNSGGALVDIEGRLVGINTSILTRSGGSNGIGFAIPANLVARFIDLAQSGADRYEVPWAGLGGQPVTADIAQGLGLEAPQGFLVAAIHPESPFARAGIAVGDVILSIDDEPVSAPQDMIYRLSVAGVGGSVRALVIRGGAREEVEVTLTPLPGDESVTTLRLPDGLPLAGLTVAEVGPRTIADFGLPLESTGVVVTDPGPRLLRGGLRPGDLVLGVNGGEVAGLDDFAELASQRTRTWLIEVWRQGRRVQLAFRL